ncbi:hypothetical protein V6N13_115608 [Hibiscus sabdariffa]|uniref:Pectinesterase n=1 Tax=Hibiscus sabdariffa TaxID=183260 RepID=A0ABR2CS87_9ROSI
MGNGVNVASTLALDQTRFSFHDLAIQVTLDQAIQAHRLVSTMNLSNFSKLISNSLAINKPTATLTSKQVGNRHLLAHEFLAWLSSVDQKLLQKIGAQLNADIVVAKYGFDNFKTISEVVAAAGGGRRTIIHVKVGVYNENVDIPRLAKSIMLIEDGMDATVVSGNKIARTVTTFRTTTIGVVDDSFIAGDITFENTVEP